MDKQIKIDLEDLRDILEGAYNKGFDSEDTLNREIYIKSVLFEIITVHDNA
mgnify:CR=1 FL=1